MVFFVFISSLPPAGVSPVRVAARRPGSRLAARSGNGPGRSPASKAPLGEATERSVASREACRVVNPPALGQAKEEPSPGRQGEGQGRGEEPGSAAPRNLPAYGARNAQKVAAGTGEALPGPAACERLPSERRAP